LIYDIFYSYLKTTIVSIKQRTPFAKVTKEKVEQLPW